MRTLSMYIVTYLIEYLGEFEFMFKTILDYESGDQMGSFDVKNPPSKISCLGTFKQAYLNVHRTSSTPLPNLLRKVFTYLQTRSKSLV
jgi:hypothetical protein